LSREKLPGPQAGVSHRIELSSAFLQLLAFAYQKGSMPMAQTPIAFKPQAFFDTKRQMTRLEGRRCRRYMNANCFFGAKNQLIIIFSCSAIKVMPTVPSREGANLSSGIRSRSPTDKIANEEQRQKEQEEYDKQIHQNRGTYRLMMSLGTETGTMTKSMPQNKAHAGDSRERQ